MATIKEIAERSGVSIGTVDRVLHERGAVKPETREKVWAVVKELGYHPNQAAQGLAVRKRNLKLGMLLPVSEGHLFFLNVRRAAMKKAEELKEYGVQVLFADVDEDYLVGEGCWREEADSRVLDFMEGLDGLALMGIDSPGIHQILERAQEKRIPIVFFNSWIPDTTALAYVGCDYEKSGRLAAGLSALCSGEDAQVCIYSESVSTKGILSESGRLQGFQQEAAERYPHMRILDLRIISDDLIDNYLSAVDMFRQYPDVNIVYVINPRDYGICRAIRRADEKKQVRIITNDLVEEQVKMLRDGTISATITQEPERQGAEPLDILFCYLAYGIVPDQVQCMTKLNIHIPQNV